MEIKIKCRINSMKINGKNKSVGVTVCDEMNFNNSVWTLGLNVDNNQPCSFKSKNSTIEKANDFFDFISAHSRETFIITIEEKNEEVDIDEKNKTTKKNKKTSATIKLDGVVYKVVGIELIYG